MIKGEEYTSKDLSRANNATITKSLWDDEDEEKDGKKNKIPFVCWKCFKIP